MRKLIALGLVALFALTLAVALMGCGGQKTESTEQTTETAPPGETTTMPDTGMGGMTADTTQMAH
jgi:hypothetical protein